ncbi:MAG: hypothetical protein ABSH20_09110 [Tepidisphaeraceae bacterium]|jgi:hypothetical protein
MTTSLTDQRESQRNTPTWLNAVIVLLVLLVGLWAVYYFTLRKPPEVVLQSEEVVDGGFGRRAWAPPTSRPYNGANNQRWQGGGGPGGGGGGGGRGNMNMPAPSRNEAIRRTGSGGIRARYNDVLLSASYSEARGVRDVDLNYSFDLMERWVSPQDIQLHMMAWRASNISNTGQAVGLTDEQRKKLLDLKYHMTVTPDELAKVGVLLTTWVAAENNPPARDKASAAILALMAELGKLHEPATKSLFKARIAAIPTILTTEQLDKLRDIQRAGNQPGAPAPAPAPAPTPVLATPTPTLAPATRPAPATSLIETPATAGPAINLVPGAVPTTRPTTRPVAP